MNEVYEFLKKCNVFYIATCDGDQPRVRPFGALNVFEDKLYIQTGKVKNVFKQMSKNNKVELVAFDGQVWCCLEGKVILDDRREAKEAMLDANPMLKGMYSADDSNTAVLYFKDAKATFYSFTAAPKVIEF